MKRTAFTLIELLVVIAIIAVLIALLVPAVQKAREQGSRAQCLNNLKQIALGTLGYHEVFKKFPAGIAGAPSFATWQVGILPYLEQGNKFQQFDLTTNVNAAVNANARVQDIPTYLCPSDRSAGVFPDPVSGNPFGRCNYLGNMGTHAWQFESNGATVKNTTMTGVFAANTQCGIRHILDGTSTTAFFSEIKRGARPNNDGTDVTQVALGAWGAGNAAANANNLTPVAACNAPVTTFNYLGLQYCFGPLNSMYTHTVPINNTGRDCMVMTADQFHVAARSYHPGGVNVAFVDGSVRFVTDGVNFGTWQALGTRCGGEVVNDF